MHVVLPNYSKWQSGKSSEEIENVAITGRGSGCRQPKGANARYEPEGEKKLRICDKPEYPLEAFKFKQQNPMNKSLYIMTHKKN